MPASHLTPNHQLLCQDYVLIQAWKKTASYIRSRNSFADNLDLDLTEISLPRFLERLAERLATPEDWKTDRIRMVLAPKSQPWRVDESGNWAPEDECRLRPLAHLALKDQVAATAVMLCLADQIETAQRDPTIKVSLETPSRERTISYGNRLLCDKMKGSNRLSHRWGSAALYRGYYQDYKNFISRPTSIAKELASLVDGETYIIHADLSAFYDRISPALLYAAINGQLSSDCDDKFRTLVKNLFSWKWHRDDTAVAKEYKKTNRIESFRRIALPQGLVSAGFFSNLLMLGVDNMLRDSINQEIDDNIVLIDVCRYVDDFRIVIGADSGPDCANNVKEMVASWLEGILATFASSLTTEKHSFSISQKKMSITNVAMKDHNVVYQSHRMNRIQEGISGGFDAIEGAEILTAIEALISSQRRFEEPIPQGQHWAWSIVPDTNDGTVKRFAAGRYRKTYRSIRPLLESRVDPDSDDLSIVNRPLRGHQGSSNTREELDHDAKVFAYSLVRDWTNDASNVRLLRIALDLWPSPQLLKIALDLLRTLTENDTNRVEPQSRVAWYTIAELFRVATFETGCVNDEDELLPEESDIKGYRRMLYDESVRLSNSLATIMPWYVAESILFFQAAYGQLGDDHCHKLVAYSRQHYKNLFRLLVGDHVGLSKANLVKYLILVRNCFPTSYHALDASIEKHISSDCFRTVVSYDPSYAVELINKYPELESFLENTLAVDDLCLRSADTPDPSGFVPLSEVARRTNQPHQLRDELSLLQFSLKFLAQLKDDVRYKQIRPTEVFVRFDNSSGNIEAVELKPRAGRDSSMKSLYCPPNWCDDASRWRFHLGFLLRFLVTRSLDFTSVGRLRVESEADRMYRVPSRHSYHRIHGFYNAQAGLGDNWLPISRWFERLLFRLLAWPGIEGGSLSREHELLTYSLEFELTTVQDRLDRLGDLKGKSAQLLILPMCAPFPYKRPRIRACIVQSIFPSVKDLVKDNTLSSPLSRRMHRNHLAAALSAVNKMLYWRDLHLNMPRSLDLLILPELAVNALDIRSHLKPFALKHKSTIVAGLSYRNLGLGSGMRLVNSAVWVIPFQSTRGGWDIFTRCQGKEHVAPTEERLLKGNISGFRPCQWLIEYDWDSQGTGRFLNLTASICYDATDLELAARLRTVSDVFIVPAFNKDVETFDNLAMHLHYNMFQMVVIANSGQYGGSCVFWPRKRSHERRVFHSHGQSQCSIGFFDIDVEEFLQRRDPQVSDDWKSVPAGIG